MVKPKAGIIIFLPAVFLFLTFIHTASADGMIHISDPDMWPGWRVLNENTQMAAINYENGRENMLLAVDVKNLSGKQAVWIFPVPAKPEETEIDIIKGFPALLGSDLKKSFMSTVSGGFLVMSMSQVYTVPFSGLFLLGGGFGYAGMAQNDLGGTKGSGIEVYEHIEEMGLTTEVVTAEDGNALYNYMTNKGTQLPSESKSILDEYAGKRYSFVVSWISDIQKFKNETKVDSYGSYYYPYWTPSNTLGVYVSFPSEKIYFPLRPTSVYGNASIPIIIYVMNYVTPELYPGISGKTMVNYYFFDRYYEVPAEFWPFFNIKPTYTKMPEIQNLKYTKIRIETSSSSLTQDLWIRDSAPPKLALMDFLKTYFWIWAIAIFAIISCLSSMISGMIVFRKDNLSKKYFALLGLSNFLSILGLIFVSNALDKKYPQPEKAPHEKRKRLPLIMGAIIGVIFIAAVMITLGFVPRWASDNLFLIFIYVLMFFVILLFAIVPLIIVGGFMYVFDKNARTKKFVILFSALFMIMLLISWLALGFLI